MIIKSRHVSLGWISVLSLASLACSRKGEESLSVSSLALASDSTVALDDRPATDAVAALRAAFANGTHKGLSFKVFELQAVAPVQATLETRAQELGVSGAIDPASDQNKRGVTTTTHRLVRNEVSGSEFFADYTRHHRGQGVPESQLRPKAEYIGAARRYIAERLGSVTGGASLYPYKVRTYMNASGHNKSAPTSVEAYQVAVAFNMEIDGLPVIGSGGKVTVHLTPQGEVIAHESTVRSPASPAQMVSGSELVSPAEAKAEVEGRLRSRGLDLSKYSMTREEFGYYRRGRTSGQRYLAPYYAYFYEPISREITGRRMVELVPALKHASALALTKADDDTEAARKAEVIAKGPAATPRPRPVR